MRQYLMLYFLAGVLPDFLLPLNWRFIAKEKAVPAAIFSFVVTMVSMLVLYHITPNWTGSAVSWQFSFTPWG